MSPPFAAAGPNIVPIWSAAAVVVPTSGARVTQVFAEVPISSTSFDSSFSLVESESWESLGPVTGNTASVFPASSSPGTRNWSVQHTAHPGTWDTGPYAGTHAIRLDTTDGTLQNTNTGLGSGLTVTSMGFYLKTGTTNPGSDTDFVELGANSGNLQIGSDGTLKLLGSGWTIATAVAMTDNAWHYIEVFSAINGGGTFDNYVHIDGTLHGSALNKTFGLDPSFVSLGSAGALPDSQWFSMFVWGQATAHTDLPGAARVECLFPTSDGTHRDFTPKTGSAHYAMVAEVPEDGLGSYVIATTAGNIDSYNHSSLVSGSGTVLGVNVAAIADNNPSPDHTLAAYVLDAGGAQAGTGTTLNDGTAGSFAASYAHHAFPLNGSGSAWSLSGANACEIGQKVAS